MDRAWDGGREAQEARQARRLSETLRLILSLCSASSQRSLWITRESRGHNLHTAAAAKALLRSGFHKAGLASTWPSRFHTLDHTPGLTPYRHYTVADCRFQHWKSSAQADEASNGRNAEAGILRQHLASARPGSRDPDYTRCVTSKSRDSRLPPSGPASARRLQGEGEWTKAFSATTFLIFAPFQPLLLFIY